MRKKKCKNKECGIYFRPPEDSPGIRHCSTECAEAILKKHWAKVRAQQERARKRSQRALKKQNSAAVRALNADSLPHQIKLTQQAFNRLIVLLDKDKKTCASCGREKCGSYWDCGHVKSVGSHPELRFDFLNAYKQGSACNRQQRLSSRDRVVSKQYEDRLPPRTVEYLNGPHKAKNYTREGLKAMRAVFAKEIRHLEKGYFPTRNWRQLEKGK